ncbi:MAG: amino acid permease [Candidatus Woesearchaeota archaeon]|nr:amino acid permease [Candidatus Woesearchaeota archaeon]
MVELKRTLGFWMTSSFIFLNLVNTGIFFGVQLGIAVAGIDSLIAWVLLAGASIYTGMCFSELITMFPTAGGVYEFAKQAYGRFTSFEIGWIIWIINNIATGLLIIAAMEYLLPDIAFTFGSITLSSAIVKTVCSIAIILLVNFIAYRGADDSARLMVTLAIFTLVICVLVIVPGLWQVHTSTFVGFSWEWSLVLLAGFLLSETFFGWESVSFMAEEIKNPLKTIPRAMNMTTVFVSILSLGVAGVTVGVLGVDGVLNSTRPFLAVLQAYGMDKWLLLFANIGIVVTFLGNAAGSIIGNPRLLMALSRDKLFIEQFADIHPQFQTPYRGIMLQTLVAILIVLLSSGAYQQLLEMLIAPSILLYASMLLLVPFFRWKRPKEERPYKAPLGKFLPLVLVVGYMSLLGVWITYDVSAMEQLRLLGSFMLFSVPVYLLLTYFYDPDALVGTINKFSFLNLWLENILLPKRIRREVLALLPEAKGKKLLEFGAGVGTMTMHLAEHVGADGKVYALELSEGNHRILQSRASKHRHVHALHDPHMVNRVHPDIEEIDLVVSVGYLSYIQDIRKVLGEMHAILPSRGQVYFIEYIDFFWFLPNPKWLSDPATVQQAFADAGFAVSVKIKRALFWKYMFVTGIKKSGNHPYI